MPAERGVAVLGFALALATAWQPARAVPPPYGQVDTFQPGKKYSCVPTADRRGWKCTEIGKGKAGKPAAPAATKPPARPQPPPKPELTLPTASANPDATTRSSALPGYLTNPSARRRPPVNPTARTPAAAPPAAGEPRAVIPKPASTHEAAPQRPPTSQAVPASSIAASKPVERAPEAATPHAAPVPNRTLGAPAAPNSAPANPQPAPVRPAGPVRQAPTRTNDTVHDGNDFLGLPGNHFIVELAHAPTRTGLADTMASLQLPHGDLYRLHLRQFGNDTWLLVWGDFADVGAARAARARLAARAGFTPGWPRLIAPLQSEVRRTLEP